MEPHDNVRAINGRSRVQRQDERLDRLMDVVVDNKVQLAEVKAEIRLIKWGVGLILASQITWFFTHLG